MFLQFYIFEQFHFYFTSISPPLFNFLISNSILSVVLIVNGMSTEDIVGATFFLADIKFATLC